MSLRFPPNDITSTGTITLNGVQALELAEGLQERAEWGVGLYATKKYLTSWESRNAFQAGLLGNVQVVGGQGGTITRRVPYQYPDNPFLYVKSFTSEAFGPPLGEGPRQIQPSYALHTVEFGTPDFNFGGADGTGGDGNNQSRTYSAESMTFSGEFLTLPDPKNNLKFQSTANVVPENAAVLIPSIEYTVTRHGFPYLPMDAIMAAVGTVNSANFTVGDGTTFAPETSLFCGGEAQRTTTTDGSEGWDVSYKFLWRPVSWGKMLTTAGTWDYVVDKASGTKFLYGLADHNSLP